MDASREYIITNLVVLYTYIYVICFFISREIYFWLELDSKILNISLKYFVNFR